MASVEKLPMLAEGYARLTSELKALREELAKSRQLTVEEWVNTLPPQKQQEIRRLVGGDPTSVQ
jgi:hypothetical protein